MKVPPKSNVRPRYGLKNTFSGQAGELAVAATLVRAGFRVLQPLWSDDYTDLMILQEAKGWVIPIPVQVKSVQQASKPDPIVLIQGLKKKYIQRVPSLCLAIYSPTYDKIWFVPGADNIRAVHQAWTDEERTGAGRKPKEFDEILPSEDVPLRVDLSIDGNRQFDEHWLVDRMSPIDLRIRIGNLADRLVDQARQRDSFADEISALLRSPLMADPEETDENADNQ